MLSGISLKGDTFFYPNPLLSLGQHERSPWFACACCPSNLPRFMLSIPGHAYAVAGDKVFVNLYVQGQARVTRPAATLASSSRPDYPWDGDVTHPRRRRRTAGRFTLRVRVPGWARRPPGARRPVPGPRAGRRTASRSASTASLDADSPGTGLSPSSTREWKAGDTHRPAPADAGPPGRRATRRSRPTRGAWRSSAGRSSTRPSSSDNGGRVTNLAARRRGAARLGSGGPTCSDGVTVDHRQGDGVPHAR